MSWTGFNTEVEATVGENTYTLPIWNLEVNSAPYSREAGLVTAVRAFDGRHYTVHQGWRTTAQFSWGEMTAAAQETLYDFIVDIINVGEATINFDPGSSNQTLVMILDNIDNALVALFELNARKRPSSFSMISKFVTREAPTWITKDDPSQFTLFFWAEGTNGDGSILSAGELIDEKGIWKRNANGTIEKIIATSPRTVSSFDIWVPGKKIVVAYTNYEIYTYNLDGSGESLLYTVLGSSIGMGSISVMTGSTLYANKLYVRHGTGTFSWSVSEVDLTSGIKTGTYGGSGSFSYPHYITASEGKIYGLAASLLGYAYFYRVGLDIAPIKLTSNGYAGIGQNARGIVHNPEEGRVYAGEWNGFNWSSFSDDSETDGGDVLDHGINAGVNHYYDPTNYWVWRGDNGLVHTKNVPSTAGIEVKISHNGTLMGVAEYGDLNVDKVVPYYG